ncbi:hypothetical protein COCMIDRAFT_26730 [Bipolaris oryzae ATCC 44560]|uniref:Uncharacterized protein n=1 Tax=Bipolaris oryzae ATCC 44560 TaxID=930090 RepID=W6Z071_COCMI|nr:uncharacterized protein COCMIDRAFT_26730 [Bipolaris oryzae ATCC 44560]EUC45057.1 hypothetical protein COCMIDRAFT_26730 [Bipolaris oryzae ATCC 44560]
MPLVTSSRKTMSLQMSTKPSMHLFMDKNIRTKYRPHRNSRVQHQYDGDHVPPNPPTINSTQYDPPPMKHDLQPPSFFASSSETLVLAILTGTRRDKNKQRQHGTDSFRHYPLRSVSQLLLQTISSTSHNSP